MKDNLMQKMIASFDQLLKDSNLPDEDIITNHGTFITNSPIKM